MLFKTLGEIFNRKVTVLSKAPKNVFCFNIASYYVTRGSYMLATQCGSRYVISQSGCVVVSQCVISFGLC